MKRELTCIVCPMGCSMEVTGDENTAPEVRGNSCRRGAEYAVKELTSPTRMVTTTVRVQGGKSAVVPVKTAGYIPKGKIMDCVRQLKKVQVQAPVELGCVILKNVAGTGISVVAAGSVKQA